MSNLEQHLSLSAFNAGADKGKPIVAELTLVLGGMDGYGCWGAKDTRKTKQLLKNEYYPQKPNIELGARVWGIVGLRSDVDLFFRKRP